MSLLVWAMIIGWIITVAGFTWLTCLYGDLSGSLGTEFNKQEQNNKKKFQEWLKEAMDSLNTRESSHIENAKRRYEQEKEQQIDKAKTNLEIQKYDTEKEKEKADIELYKLEGMNRLNMDKWTYEGADKELERNKLQAIIAGIAVDPSLQKDIKELVSKEAQAAVTAYLKTTSRY